MDVNGTRFHLLLGEADWRAGTGDFEGRELECDYEGGWLGLPSEARRFPAPPGSRDLTPRDRRGASRDRFGNWFFVGPDRTDLRLVPAGAPSSRTYWPRAEEPAAPGEAFAPVRVPSPPPLRILSGLVVTARHYLVVGAPSLPGLIVFDLHGGGPPVAMRWPETPGGFEPVDMAPAPGGGAWILDAAGSRPGRARVWLLDRYLQVVDLGGLLAAPPSQPDFSPASGEPPPEGLPPGPRIDPRMAVEVDAADPASIAGLPDGSVLVLDRSGIGGRSEVHRFGDGGRLSFPFPGEELGKPAHDIAFVPDPVEAGRIVTAAAGPGDAAVAGRASVAGLLFVVDVDGNQAFAFRVSPEGDRVSATGDYYPLRMFTGKAIVAAGGVAHYDLGDRWLPIVGRTGRRYAPEGSVVTRPFDGMEPDCVWHRLMLDACIPPGTAVGVESRAANSVQLLEGQAWEMEPSLYLRSEGPELPVYRPFPMSGENAGGGTWETLFQRSRGRFLQVRLTLRGNGRESPRLAALRAYYPRFSYLRQYLPDVYEEDGHAASFLDRYLANVEGLYTSIEGRIERAEALFDVRTTPGEFLPWLAAWLGTVLDPGWEEARRRLFLHYAVALFRQRGTRDGLVRAIRLATDPCPDDRLFLEDVADRPGVGSFGVRIVERFVTRSLPGVAFGDPTVPAGPRVASTGPRWRPAEGAEDVHARWGAFLKETYGSEAAAAAVHGNGSTSFGAARFPPLTPPVPEAARDWRRFVRGYLDVTYDDVGEADTDEFRSFLSQRYRRASALADAWDLSGGSRPGSFDDVALPTELPAQAVALRDWIHFVSMVLPMVRRAHRFRVLVPVRFGESDEDRARRIGRVEHLVRIEKPSHTVHEVSGYWAALRVGEARVGFETVVGEGSRFTAVVLGLSPLGASFSPGRSPWDVADRFVVGREAVARERGGDVTRKETPDD